MFLFQRMATLRGGVRRPMAWAAEITAFVNQNSDIEVSLWAANFGFPLGTVVWSARVESRAQLNEFTSALLAKEAYHDLVEKGQDFITTPGQDSLRELVHGEGLSSSAPPVGSFATVVTAQPAPGQIVNAVTWGIEITKMFHAISGTPIALYTDCYGPFGQLTWIGVAANAAAVDAAASAVNSNADYIASIDAAGAYFVAGSASQGLASRIA